MLLCHDSINYDYFYFIFIIFPYRHRYNFTNVDEPFFILDALELINGKLNEEDDSVLIVVYAVNQKGKSAGFAIRDIELGAIVKVDRGEL